MAVLASTRACTVAPRRVAARQSARPGRAPVVVCKALSLQEASNWIANAFVKILSKPQSNVDQFAENNFSGKITRSRKPFKDGWQANPSVPTPSTMEALRIDEQEVEGYLDGAVKRVVNNNFKGDNTEPDWVNTNGWKGDIHKRATARDARDGFHAKKL